MDMHFNPARGALKGDHEEYYGGGRYTRDRNTYWYVGQPSLLDRFAIRRVSANRKQLRRQNQWFYSIVGIGTPLCVAALSLLCFALLPKVAAILVTSVLGLATLAALFIFACDEDGIQSGGFTTDAGSVRLCDRRLTRHLSSGKVLPVWRTPEFVAARTYLDMSPRQFNDWLVEHQDYKRLIDAIFSDPQRNALTKLYETKPDTLSPEDHRLVEQLKSGVGDIVSWTIDLITQRDEAAEKVDADLKAKYATEWRIKTRVIIAAHQRYKDARREALDAHLESLKDAKAA